MRVQRTVHEACALPGAFGRKAGGYNKWGPVCAPPPGDEISQRAGSQRSFNLVAGPSSLGGSTDLLCLQT